MCYNLTKASSVPLRLTMPPLGHSGKGYMFLECFASGPRCTGKKMLVQRRTCFSYMKSRHRGSSIHRDIGKWLYSTYIHIRTQICINQFWKWFQMHLKWPVFHMCTLKRGRVNLNILNWCANWTFGSPLDQISFHFPVFQTICKHAAGRPYLYI